MDWKKKPLLSIGIIFKNEMRCIERCLKSLVPLKELAPCEIVMADTGSTDGSREIAEKYADILFDFPWINDFAAARNAVMDRCTGRWYLSIDCDEWLTGNLLSMIVFLQKDREYDYVSLTIRNFKTQDTGSLADYNEFAAIRILRMSTGLRFEGAVHERWPGPTDGSAQRIMILGDNTLFHDGYAVGVWDVQKVVRNLTLLKKKQEENPDDLLIRVQLIESGSGTSEYLNYVRLAVQGVKDKLNGWQRIGPPIMRNAVAAAVNASLPELDEWVEITNTLFPDSIFTLVDVNYLVSGACWNKNQYADCIRYGEAYFKALEDYDAKKFNITETLVDVVMMAAPPYRQNLRLFLVGAYIRERRFDKAVAALKKMDCTAMGPVQAENLSRTYQHLYWTSELDVAELIRGDWAELCKPEPTEAAAQQRRERFVRNATEVFRPGFIRQEPNQEHFYRHAYGVFKALEGMCDLGTAAALMDAEGADAAEKLLNQVENWDEMPIYALERALLRGVSFPLSGEKRMPLEQMDRLAVRLAQSGGDFKAIQERAAAQGMDTLEKLSWGRSVALAAVKTSNWKDQENGMKTARFFARIEEKYIPACYAQSMLTDDTIWALPIMHRFGFYCAQAFEALDGGDVAGYVRLLRKGLSVCGEMKSLVEFLLNNTPELHAKPEPSAELKALADQIRTALAGFAPDDPAVAALKQSEAYQKVAHLIEGIAVPVIGGLMQ